MPYIQELLHFQNITYVTFVFQVDCGQFVNEYHENGPMQPGLTPREASDRLQMFQNHFDALWRKHSSYTIGEDLFGLPHSEQPELNKIKKELNLLQVNGHDSIFQVSLCFF